MDYTTTNNMNFNGGYAGNYYAPTQPFPGQPMVYNPVPAPQNINALSEEEIKLISQAKPSKLDINISQEDNLRAMCNHKHNGRDMVQMVNDGSNDVFCPICQERWNPAKLTKEEITEVVNTLIAQMQNSKWAGDLNVALIRDYYPMIPLLKKFPDIYDYAMASFNKYYAQNGYNASNEAAVYAQYNNLMGYAPQSYGNYYTQQPTYQQAPVGNYYEQQPSYAQPAQMNGYYAQATPVNPMQAPYGVAQNPMNPQFVDQANAMMGGSVYTQPGAPVGYTPNYAPAQPGVNQQATSTATADDGTAKTETTVNLG